ncbi:MAG: transglutaminase-like domain-containing protein [Pseudohongiellaceae bacterium]
MSVGHACLALFLIVLSWHLGLSMELPLVGWLGSGLTVLAAGRLIRVERPTLGLGFVLFATGALAGNQILEDWAVQESWPQENGFGAGIILSLLLYLLWRFAARADGNSERVLDPDTQTILVWGLLSLLLISPAASTVVTLFGATAPVLALLGMFLACLCLLADRCGVLLSTRLLLLLPVLAVLPPVLIGLNLGQAPVVATLGKLFPRSGDYTSTGFSPYQTLRPSVFLRPSTEAVLRIETEAPPTPYLAGNRLVTLSEELVWLPSERPLDSYSMLDAQLLPSGQRRFPVANHHYGSAGRPDSEMAVHSLDNDNFIFVAPGTTHIAGPFSAISRNAADVWTPNFERGADQRWLLESGAAPTPDAVNDETLSLPGFWDEALQDHSEAFAAPGGERQQTVTNVVDYFLGRDYTLRTDFDPSRPFHDFFLNDRAAYCFWFASATTLALRANGIPSRLVGGYVMHERLSDDLWLVRERDAHSWVEWQDEAGYWHTVDPTPPSIAAFFGGYESSTLSQWYHRLAGQWQQLLDRILEDELLAGSIRYGGLAILVFLFAREYRRIRQRREQSDQVARQWQQLWRRFLRVTGLPERPDWTATTYLGSLPADWPDERREQVAHFLDDYQRLRFAYSDGDALDTVKSSLGAIDSRRRR